jgi:DNA-binding transcriptional MerR regulator
MTSPVDTTDPDDIEHTLTIDQLSAASGIPSRTIRYYQTKGVLPHPSRRSRSSSYGPEHLERLRLIVELQDRGLRLDAIRDVVRQFEEGGDSIQDWLGLGDRLRTTWADQRPELLTRDQLLERLGQAGAAGQAAITELEKAGLISPAADHADTFLVNAPALLEINRRLGDAGIDLPTALGAERIVRRRLSKLADEMVEHFSERAGKGFAASNTPADLARASDALRVLGLEAVQLVFTQEMQRAMLEFVERGGGVAPEVPKARHRSRTRRSAS